MSKPHESLLILLKKLNEMSEEECQTFIVRIPARSVSNFLKAVSNLEVKPDEQSAVKGDPKCTEALQQSSSNEAIVRAILKKKGHSAATTVSLPPELIDFTPSEKDLDSLNKATKYYLLKVLESKVGILIAHKNVALTLAEIKIHFKRERNDECFTKYLKENFNLNRQ